MDRVRTEVGELSVMRDGPPDAATVIVLGHGAGAPMSSPSMTAVAAGLAARGYRIWRFAFPYAEEGRRAPDRAPVLEAAFRGIVAAARDARPDARLVLGGRSMGGRIASHLAASGTPADGLVLLGYPLHPPGRPDRPRTAHLPRITIPTLFVQGTRDPFCPLETLRTVVSGLGMPVEIAVIDDADHGFKVPRSSGRTTEAAFAEVVDAVARWVGSLGSERAVPPAR